MSVFQRMVRFSKSNFSSSINSCSFLSSNSSGNPFKYGRISELVDSECSIKFYSSFPSKSSERPTYFGDLSRIVQPDGQGGYYVNTNNLCNMLLHEIIHGENFKTSLQAKMERGENPRPWLRYYAKKDQTLVGKSKYDLDKVPFELDQFRFSAYLRAARFDMTTALVSITAASALGVGAIMLVFRT